MTTGDESPKGQNTKQDKVPESGEQPDLEAMIKELPEKYQPVIRHLVTGVFNSLVQTNERLAQLEKRPAVQDAPGALDGLTGDQRYNILMARASAPAAQAQMQLYQGLLAGMRGNTGGGGLDDLIKSADKLQSLKALLTPEPTPLQVAMEKAQISQNIAQTRLMNKVVGKASMDYLDKLEASLGEGSPE